MIRTDPLSPRSQEKAEQILRGALPEFLKYGYERTSMDKVAQAAGVSKQTLYSHFSDKDGLFTALVKRMACEKFRLVWSQPLCGEPHRVLRELGHRLLQEINDPEYLCFMRLIIAESAKRQDLSQIFLKNVAIPAMGILKKYFQDHPELKIADAEVTARIFVGTLIHHLMTQEMLHGREIMPLSDERLVNNLVNLVVGEPFF